MVNVAEPLVIIADDDSDLLGLMDSHLVNWGYQVASAQNKTELLQLVSCTAPDLILLDLHFGEDDGLEVLIGLLRENPNVPIVILTAYGSITSAVHAIKLGAYDYLTKPLELDRLQFVVQRAIEKRRLAKIPKGAQRPGEKSDSSQAMLGESMAMVRLRKLIEEVSPTDATVLILGESGTGKELVARAIHEQSSRRHGVCVPVNMAALPASLAESVLFGHEKGSFTGADSMQKGWCEVANKGTLFLDEIGEMDISLQAKLLRFLQEHSFQRVGSNQLHRVDVRIVAATNRDPERMVRDGRLREDLYYRINVLPVAIPPLRDRTEDIPLLADHFVGVAARANQRDVTGFTPEAIDALKRYTWPGNVRQLENLVKRLVILSRTTRIDVNAIPFDIVSGTAGGGGTYDGATAGTTRSMDHVEKLAILEALSNAKGNVVEAARMLGVGQATVYRKVKRYGIDLKSSRQNEAGDGDLPSERRQLSVPGGSERR